MASLPPSASADLALHHHPISRLFEQPQTPEEWEQHALSAEQVGFFRENGYVSGVRILTEEQCDILCAELDEISDPSHPRHSCWYTENTSAAPNEKDPDTLLLHALGGWRVGVGFHDLLWAPAFRMAAYQLLGGDFRFYHDQVFAKPPDVGGVVSWHQDYSYWTWTKPQAHLTCWIGLDPSNEHNGCLCYVPKSHKWDLKPVTGLTTDMTAAHGVLSADEIEAFGGAQPMVLQRGEANFHHSMTCAAPPPASNPTAPPHHLSPLATAGRENLLVSRAASTAAMSTGARAPAARR